MGLYGDLKKCASGGFFSLEEVLSYGRLYNFIIGARSTGKSTAAAIWCVLDFVYNGSQWMYVRRTKDELQETAADFTTAALGVIEQKTGKKYIVEYHAGKYFLTGEGIERTLCGYAIPLSLHYKYKSRYFEKVNNIVYDEFLADSAQLQRYLGGSKNPDAEPRAMLDIYKTVARKIGQPTRDGVHAFMMGNAADLAAAPMLLYYNVYDALERSPEARIIAPKGEPWMLCKARAQAVSGNSASEQAKLARGRDFDYVYGDSGTDDKAFVDTSKSIDCPVSWVNLIISGKYYMVTRSEGFERLYCKHGRDPYKSTISCDLLGHDGKRDFAMIKAWHEMPELSIISDAFKRGNVYFDSVKTKLDFLSYLKYI